jgi:hypothetical protein
MPIDNREIFIQITIACSINEFLLGEKGKPIVVLEGNYEEQNIHDSQRQHAAPAAIQYRNARFALRRYGTFSALSYPRNGSG